MTSDDSLFTLDHALRRKFVLAAGKFFPPMQSLYNCIDYQPLLARPKGLGLDPFGADRANQFIAEGLAGPEPFFAGRFGSTELTVTLRWLKSRKSSVVERLYSWLAIGEFPFFSTTGNVSITYDSGFYPLEKKSLGKFAELMITSMPELDLIGSWVPGENLFEEQLSHAEVTELSSLEPFFSESPWTSALAGKRVLVVHPFVESIRNQYELNRAHLFDDPALLPKFDLLTIKAPQTLSKASSEFPTWFEAFDWLDSEVQDQRFDVAIVGAGAYGFPLSARIKKRGGKVIHLGGATQLLFGIIGKRWELMHNYAPLMNGHWVRPQPSEVPTKLHRKGIKDYW